MHFGENQISLGLIRLLLLSTAHHPVFQHRCVRTSTNSYIRFPLAMDRSPQLRVCRALLPSERDAHFALAFAAAPRLKRLTMQYTTTRRFIMQKARRHTGCRPRAAPTVLRPLVGIWFQVLLTRLTAVLFTFHSRYFCAIGRQGVLSLKRWSSRIHAGFHVSGATWVPVSEGFPFAYRAVTFYGRPFHTVLLGTPL
jgi:hypothetical protein